MQNCLMQVFGTELVLYYAGSMPQTLVGGHSLTDGLLLSAKQAFFSASTSLHFCDHNTEGVVTLKGTLMSSVNFPR